MCLSFNEKPGVVAATHAIGLLENAGAGLVVAALRPEIPATVAVASGLFSGFLQNVATGSRHKIASAINLNLSGAPKNIAKAAVMTTIYTVHVFTLRGIGSLLGHNISPWNAVVATGIGGGYAAAKYMLHQRVVDEAGDTGKRVPLF